MTKPLRPFFGYFGGKWRLSKYYPNPKYDTIIEPFAGSAGYSLRHGSGREVILVEKNPVIAGIWRYLINATADEILTLSDDLEQIPRGPARDLAGMWCAKAPTSPRKSRGGWCTKEEFAGALWWEQRCRERIASQLPAIRGWTIYEGSYEALQGWDSGGVTWFVDPPYEKAGTAYPNGTRDLDFTKLGEWCKSLRGQVIVCERFDAKWLEFTPLEAKQARLKKDSSHREGVWIRDDDHPGF
jgi:site-specific DNA-adenine methylase